MAVKAKQALLDASIVADGVDISNTSNEVTIESSRAEKEVTTFQGGGYDEQTPGLKSAVMNIAVFQDRSAGSVHQTFSPLYENGTPFLIVVKPDDDVVSAENPASVMIGKLYKYTPIGAKVGEPESMTLEVKNGSKLGLKEAKTPEELITIEGEASAILGGGSGSGSGS